MHGVSPEGADTCYRRSLRLSGNRDQARGPVRLAVASQLARGALQLRRAPVLSVSRSFPVGSLEGASLSI